ncbi:hypothetical protein COY90_00980 [Candidatus Roizmanbacteria bacterium CG_4_10_14_0_8_um_filter_39_9]|uniref:Asl1-like glycosyl hydrolase catalytic domain-containing protein n=1 Tax=Candidatus Roizmanbacteria bacterium CG_4_10_14_0_8_um_filter_39_9 TaxID=1974829 RepID=A0A2M7QEQ3_9BACT|nr:MAG: hypothetical protein COY90_00980 [Candidatus Roizmanbacteria bacterium CG_4_10_14_0_8_um_filter_39_9]
MKNYIFTSIFIFVLIIFLPHIIFASPNNKVGISLLQPTDEDIKMASELVNSSGGDYGYATLVIQENDRSVSKWQDVFEKLREAHLIPIVRLATQPEGENWRRPTLNDAPSWAEFLNVLNWVTEKRYIVLFNEPNHGSEWGGEVDAKNYREVAVAFAQKLKEKNKDFFIMSAGLDGAAPNALPLYEDEEAFLAELFQKNDTPLENVIDGWASHSYPNPGFSASPWDAGKKSIRGYDWELQTIQSLGVSKNFPVFITETGWVSDRLTRATVAAYYKQAFENVWGPDPRVMAVTPFVFNYQSDPFLGFSWKKQGEESYYAQYYSVWEIPKVLGTPGIRESGTIQQELPAEFVADSSYRFSLRLRNTGQAIWDTEGSYSLGFSSTAPFEYIFSDIKNLRPYQDTQITLFVKTKKSSSGDHVTTIQLKKSGSLIAQTDPWHFTILPLPSLKISSSLFPKLISNSKSAEVQIYDEKEWLAYKKAGLSMNKGQITLGEVQNIILGKKYRVVLLVPGYLPRQNFTVLRRGENKTSLRALLPFDFNSNGALGWDDLGALLQAPSKLKMLLP